MMNQDFKSRFCAMCGVAIVTFGIGAAATLHFCQERQRKGVYVQLDDDQKACLVANFKSTDPSRNSFVTVSGNLANSGTINQGIAPPADIFDAAKGLNNLILYVDPFPQNVIDSPEYSA